MALMPYDVIAASKPFQILVGPDKKSFMMHSELLARLSKPLNALVNGEMKEASDGVAIWPEVDEGTFVRFWEFAYAGNYTPPEPVLIPLSLSSVLAPLPKRQLGRKKKKQVWEEPPPELEPEPAPEPQAAPEPEPELELVALPEPPEPNDLWHGWGMPKAKDCPASSPLRPGTPKGARLWDRFKKLQYAVPVQPPASPEESRPPSQLDHTEVFLAHARLYVLADYYDIEALAVLSLRKLHQALAGFAPPSAGRADDVTAVLDYGYANTVDKGGSSSQDRLRHLLTLYVACKVEDLWGSGYFREVLERSGELSKAVIGSLLDRLD